ncbi:MAG: serine/threonine protein kinase [Myxococcales bacterium]|nr:serine/threonine protein kinase [Myxococcales bacterium]
MTLEPGTSIGKYVVRRKIAEGGMAEIYLCSSRGPEGFEKDVVIKRIRAFLASDPSFVKMFVAEARVASRLNHPNVVQIFDFDKHEDTYYIAMEYVRGRSLLEAQRRARELMEPMGHTLVAHLGAEVARGLHYAHGLKDKGQRVGLVHRDVTPHNVLLSFDGAVKLTDFGIAKAGDKLTVPGTLKGKFAYMSPEQARGEEVDARSDVFSLGVVLWEILTGGRLFEDQGEIAVLRAVQHRVIAAPARINSEVPAELDAIVMKALERDVAVRFQTAQELEHELARHVLAHAQGIEDTDVAAYLRKLFGAEVTTVSAADPPAGPPPFAASDSAGASASSSQRTAVIRRGGGTSPADGEDPSSPTLVVDRQVPRKPPEQPAGPAPAPEGAAGAPRPALARKVRRAALPIAAVGLTAVAAAAAIMASREVGRPAARQKAEDTARMPSSPAPIAILRAVAAPDAGEAAEPLYAGEPSAAPARAAGPPTAEAPARRTAKPSGERAPRPDEARGTLVLHVMPYATVEVDGQLVGEVEGIRRLSLPEGKHRVRIWHPKRSDEAEVVVQAGRETLHRFQAR